MSAQLSIVIPALNEAESLPRLLAQLREQTDLSLQVVVADGGSTDGTVDLVQQAGVALVRSARGRARQMNAGARATHGELLLFLHADSELESPRQLADACAMLEQARARDAHARVAGHFALRFTRSEAGHDLLFRYLEAKSALNRRYTVNGDQGLLIYRAWFDALGGFDESFGFLEDQLLADRIFLQGRWLLLPGRLGTSARRFEREGHRERYTLMAIVMGLLAGGVKEFFERVPEVYREQAAATRLDLRPFRELVLRLLREKSPGQRLAVLWRIGGFVRQNSWQLFFRRDVQRNDGTQRSLAWHDRWIAPLFDNALGTLLAMLLVCAWFYLWLPRAARPAMP